MPGFGFDFRAIDLRLIISNNVFACEKSFLKCAVLCSAATEGGDSVDRQICRKEGCHCQELR